MKPIQILKLLLISSKRTTSSVTRMLAIHGQWSETPFYSPMEESAFDAACVDRYCFPLFSVPETLDVKI